MNKKQARIIALNLLHTELLHFMTSGDFERSQCFFDNHTLVNIEKIRTEAMKVIDDISKQAGHVSAMDRR